RRCARPLLCPLLHGRHALHPLRCGSGLHAALGHHLPEASAHHRLCPRRLLLHLEERNPRLGLREGRPIEPMTMPDKDAVLQAQSQNRAVASLLTAFPDAILDAVFDRNELTLTIAKDQIRDAARTVQQAGYNFLEDVTCIDWYPSDPRFHVIYHILSHSLKEQVRLVAQVDSVDPSIDSITSVWPSANFYEREVWDLFGVRFNGHPNLRRIMMPDEWQGHPLRKDYPVEGYR